MEFNDGNQWHFVTDVDRYVRERSMYEMRTCSAKNGRMYVDPQFRGQRERVQPRVRGYLHYQFPYQNAGSPERQATFFCDAIGELRDNEMVMLDTEAESGLRDPADFMRRWCAVVEPRLRTLAWIYVPSALAGSLTRAVTGSRIVKAPRYSGGERIGPTPSWPHDVHQYTKCGRFPGSEHGPGDVNVTALTVEQMLARCRPQRKDNDTVHNHTIRGQGALKLICPVGRASATTARAWMSASLADGEGTIRVWAQDDDSGVNDWTWKLAIRDGRSNRPWTELRDGTTQLVIQHDLTGTGTVCLETLAR